MICIKEILSWTPKHDKNHSCKYVLVETKRGDRFTTFEGRENCKECERQTIRIQQERLNWVDSPCENCGEGSLGYEEICQECCEHEFDTSEGGYCECGVNGYE